MSPVSAAAAATVCQPWPWLMATAPFHRMRKRRSNPTITRSRPMPDAMRGIHQIWPKGPVLQKG